MRCPVCGAIATVAEYIKRPICVHVVDLGPEIWDADDTDGEGRRIEESPNEVYRTPGPASWGLMVPLSMIAGQSSDPPQGKDRKPIEIHPDVRSRLNNLLFEPEMRAVGYSEFVDRALAVAEEDLARMRA